MVAPRVGLLTRQLGEQACQRSLARFPIDRIIRTLVRLGQGNCQQDQNRTVERFPSSPLSRDHMPLLIILVVFH